MIFTKARLFKGKCIYRKHENLVENMFCHAEISFPQRFISFCYSPHRTCNWEIVKLFCESYAIYFVVNETIRTPYDFQIYALYYYTHHYFSAKILYHYSIDTNEITFVQTKTTRLVFTKRIWAYPTDIVSSGSHNFSLCCQSSCAIRAEC